MSDIICVQSETSGRVMRARTGGEPLRKGLPEIDN